MLKNKAIILAKIESNYGVDPTPTGVANAILCEMPSYEVLESKVERQNIKGNFGANRFVSIGEGQKISFTCELKGSGAAGTAPEIAPLLRACNFTLATSPGVSNTFTPNSATSTGESVTIYYYLDGLLHKMLGCRGAFSIEAKVNTYAKIKFDFTGIYGGPVAQALPTPTFNSTIPPLFRAASFTLDSYAAVVDGITLDCKNDIAKRADINAATGILEYFIKERSITGKIAPEMVLPATKDFWTMWSSGSAYAFTATVGSTAGNRCVIAGPTVQIDKPKYGDRDNLVTADLDLFFCPSASGNDEVTLTFT